MSGFKLKLIGLIGTIFLTLAWSGIINNTAIILVLGTLGASSLTIFLFLMNEGLKNTRSVTKYMLRLIALSLLSAFPYFMIYHNLETDYADFYNYLSTPFMILFALGTLYVCDRWKKKSFRIVTLVVLCIFATVIRVEYAPLSLLLAFLIHEYDGEKMRRYRNFSICLYFIALSICSAMLIIFTKQTASMKYSLLQMTTLFGTVLGLPFINRYNGNYANTENVKTIRFFKYSAYLGYVLIISLFAMVKYFAKL